MPAFTVTLPDGRDWTPSFIQAIDMHRCIGCGRCFKACGRDVLELKAVGDDDELFAIEDEDDDEYEKQVMTVTDAADCIGCEACARACSRKCLTHAPREV